MHKIDLSALVAVVTIALCAPWPTYAGLLGPSNYWECILELAPGTSNDIVANDIELQCGKRFPDKSPLTGKDKVGGLFSVPTADKCVITHGKNTPSFLAARMILVACHELYLDQAP
ncbi:hypothetical protein J2797_005545 [Paraburkholderia terricola]|uniref:hypothetical protein n=1 Tax=Paraburkholderia terricola TaxID=169427 RepID=UPI00285FE529|nr:hypothetical protein [Paraburkholderia terricola]MDR6495621.1 hypothetical protein [Paraburkholderia terricola]